MESSAGSDSFGSLDPGKYAKSGRNGARVRRVRRCRSPSQPLRLFPVSANMPGLAPTPRPRCPTVCGYVTACDCAVLLAAGKGRVNPDATAVATVLLPGPLTVLTFCPGQRPLGTVRLRPATSLCHYYMLHPWGDRWRIIFASVRSGIFERIPSFRKKSVDLPGRRKPLGCSVPVCRKI